MEELQKEEIKSKLINEKISILNELEKNNGEKSQINLKKMNNTKINENEEKEKLNGIKTDGTEDLIDPKKELEKIKLSHIKQYSFFELFKKSLLFSTKNIFLKN